MPKGYVISRVDITNPDAYARYAEIEPRYGALGTFPAAGTVRFERVLPAPPDLSEESVHEQCSRPPPPGRRVDGDGE